VQTTDRSTRHGSVQREEATYKNERHGLADVRLPTVNWPSNRVESNALVVSTRHRWSGCT
jgi:hypothetical protein